MVKIYNGIRYLELSNLYDINYRLYNKIFDKINHLITKKMMTNIVLIIILQESVLIHITIYQYKKLTFHNVITLIK